ncbi:mechanosensitive ion channel family protein [Phycisphaerales bacterium AB-hyl4]|uniref:Mechanosensitive ion channel family protein n=1 Tax=Natronomicrosphaera hydrolytica TaxID=3242702 RepID=A0ABV4U3A0_9BACT
MSDTNTADQTAQPDATNAADEVGVASRQEELHEAIGQLTESSVAWLADYPWAQSLIVITVVVFLAWAVHLIVRRYVITLIGLLMGRVPNWWAGVVRDQKVFHRLVPLVPIIIIHSGVAFVPHLSAEVVGFVQRLTLAIIVLLIARAFAGVLTTINVIYSRYPISNGRPIKGYLQVVKVVLYIAAGILIVAALMNESPLIFLTGLGAMSAIIMLIFRDTLLSFVAGIQLVNNDLVRVGDWIEMPQFDADGDVLDIQLNVVRVRNWDKTITSIPTHKFLEHSFKNWRGMFEAGGRRIKRPVYVDMTTIRFLTEDEIRKFSRFLLLKDYIKQKTQELDTYNQTHCPEDHADVIANARHLTNVGTFRAYICEYLRNHPLVNQDMTMLVRQLDPGPHGLPIELFVYIKDTRFVVYEGAQSDIFDHILAIAYEFGLRVFQEPTGHDLRQLRPTRRRAAIAADATQGNGV